MTPVGSARSIFRASTLGVVVSVLLLACGGDSEESLIPTLGIENIQPAVAAVREQRGSEPEFFEINSTAAGVNLFIAVSRSEGSSNRDAVIQGRYTPEGGLVLSEELLDASGPVFVVGEMTFAPDRLVGQVVKELSGSTPLMFVLTATMPVEGVGTQAAPIRRVIMESSRGGRLAVFVDLDGVILGTEIVETAG